MRIKDLVLQARSYRHDEMPFRGERKSRKRVSWACNMTASIGGEHKPLSEIALEKRIQHHAFMRLQTFAVCAAIYEKAGLSVEVERMATLYQGGKKCASGYAAAHCSLTPRLYSDDREAIIRRIYEKKEVGLVDQKLLAVKGATLDDLEKITASTDRLSDLRQAVCKVLQAPCLFEGSWIERRVLSICHQLPIEVNEYIDLGLERSLRAEALSLLGRVSAKEVSADQACLAMSGAIRESCLRMRICAQQRVISLLKVKRLYAKAVALLSDIQEVGSLSNRKRKKLEKIVAKWREAIISASTATQQVPGAILDRHVAKYGALLDLVENRREFSTKEIYHSHLQSHVLWQSMTGIESQNQLIDQEVDWFDGLSKYVRLQESASQWSSENTTYLVGGQEDEGSKMEDLIVGLQHFSIAEKTGT